MSCKVKSRTVADACWHAGVHHLFITRTCFSLEAGSEFGRQAAGIEVACNLLDITTTSPEAVLEAIKAHAGRHGITVGAAYTTNHAPEALCKLAAEQMAIAAA